MQWQNHHFQVCRRAHLFKLFLSFVVICSAVFMQHQGESALLSMIGPNFQAAFSYIELSGPAFQRILWIFVLSLVLPWFFLFFHFAQPRNVQQDQRGQHEQQREQQDAGVPQVVEPELENREHQVERVFERQDDE
jgi:hypothetical protein